MPEELRCALLEFEATGIVMIGAGVPLGVFQGLLYQCGRRTTKKSTYWRQSGAEWYNCVWFFTDGVFAVPVIAVRGQTVGDFAVTLGPAA